MSKGFDKLVRLLKELFQLDQADLDFGIYRIMNQKHDEITAFLENDLLPQVKEAFLEYSSLDKALIENELQDAIDQAKKLKVDPETSEIVKELRAKLAESVDIGKLENEVYSDLYNFFRRYYNEGDFISQRRYKDNVYAIPYQGEEVKLYWANHDQYYIKTTEYFRDYAFKLEDGRKVHFKLVEADTEKDNVKAETGKDRRFIISDDVPVIEENGELIVRFEYREDSEKRSQDTLNELAVKTVFGDKSLLKWHVELARKAGTEANPNRTILEKHLKEYAARNTFDYFIHKDLGGFLRRELDFYIKNEIMHLDDVEHESAPKVEQYLSKIKALRKIAHKIIEFLAQIENFQKKLWLKKKFVVETNYCITLDRVPEELYPEICKNDAQREEWVRLFAIDEIERNLTSPGYSKPLTVKFLKANDKLVLDTKFFDDDFKTKLIASIEDFDKQCDGLLIHSENFQALELIQERYREQVKCIYLDPPYNTENDRNTGKFLYKDSFEHSTWCSFFKQLIKIQLCLSSDNSMFFVSLDKEEVENASYILKQLIGKKEFIGALPTIMNLKGNNDEYAFAGSHEFTLVAVKSKVACVAGCLPLDDSGELDWEEDSYGYYKQGANLKATGGNAPREKRPNLWFPIFLNSSNEAYVTENNKPMEKGDVVIWPITNGVEMSWRWSKRKISEQVHDVIVQKNNDSFTLYKKQRPSIGELPSSKPKTILYKPEYSSGNGTEQQKQLFGVKVFPNPKPLDLIKDLIRIGGFNGIFTLDPLAGSGTTGHALINLNREDDGKRRYILIEMGEYFDTVLKPRIQKVIYSKDWKDGKPVSRDGISHMFKYIRLESYEDTLNNLELKRTDEQDKLLKAKKTLKESYMLSYMLDVESKDSQSLLNVDQFVDPFNYKLKIATGSVGETKPVNVDLVETFNYLIGLTVKHIDFIRGVKVIEGTDPQGRKVLVLWRNIKEMDNDKLDDWFRKQGYSTRDLEYDLIYVNGDNNLENLRFENDTWKVRMIEEEFKRLMFDVEDV